MPCFGVDAPVRRDRNRTAVFLRLSGKFSSTSKLCPFCVKDDALVGFRSLDELLRGGHFDREIVVLCVKWYLRFQFGYRNLVEMMIDPGSSMVHITIMRWLHHFVLEFERRWRRFARSMGCRGRPADLCEDPWQVCIFILGG